MKGATDAHDVHTAAGLNSYSRPWAGALEADLKPHMMKLVELYQMFKASLFKCTIGPGLGHVRRLEHLQGWPFVRNLAGLKKAVMADTWAQRPDLPGVRVCQFDKCVSACCVVEPKKDGSVFLGRSKEASSWGSVGTYEDIQSKYREHKQASHARFSLIGSQLPKPTQRCLEFLSGTLGTQSNSLWQTSVLKLSERYKQKYAFPIPPDARSLFEQVFVVTSTLSEIHARSPMQNVVKMKGLNEVSERSSFQCDWVRATPFDSNGKECTVAAWYPDQCAQFFLDGPDDDCQEVIFTQGVMACLENGTNLAEMSTVLSHILWKRSDSGLNQLIPPQVQRRALHLTSALATLNSLYAEIRKIETRSSELDTQFQTMSAIYTRILDLVWRDLSGHRLQQIEHYRELLQNIYNANNMEHVSKESTLYAIHRYVNLGGLIQEEADNDTIYRMYCLLCESFCTCGYVPEHKVLHPDCLVDIVEKEEVLTVQPLHDKFARAELLIGQQSGAQARISSVLSLSEFEVTRVANGAFLPGEIVIGERTKARARYCSATLKRAASMRPHYIYLIAASMLYTEANKTASYIVHPDLYLSAQEERQESVLEGVMVNAGRLRNVDTHLAELESNTLIYNLEYAKLSPLALSEREQAAGKWHVLQSGFMYNFKSHTMKMSHSSKFSHTRNEDMSFWSNFYSTLEVLQMSVKEMSNHGYLPPCEYTCSPRSLGDIQVGEDLITGCHLKTVVFDMKDSPYRSMDQVDDPCNLATIVDILQQECSSRLAHRKVVLPLHLILSDDEILRFGKVTDSTKFRRYCRGLVSNKTEGDSQLCKQAKQRYNQLRKLLHHACFMEGASLILVTSIAEVTLKQNNLKGNLAMLFKGERWFEAMPAPGSMHARYASIKVEVRNQAHFDQLVLMNAQQSSACWQVKEAACTHGSVCLRHHVPREGPLKGIMYPWSVQDLKPLPPDIQAKFLPPARLTTMKQIVFMFYQRIQFWDVKYISRLMLLSHRCLHCSRINSCKELSTVCCVLRVLAIEMFNEHMNICTNQTDDNFKTCQSVMRSCVIPRYLSSVCAHACGDVGQRDLQDHRNTMYWVCESFSHMLRHVQNEPNAHNYFRQETSVFKSLETVHDVYIKDFADELNKLSLNLHTSTMCHGYSQHMERLDKQFKDTINTVNHHSKVHTHKRLHQGVITLIETMCTYCSQTHSDMLKTGCCTDPTATYHELCQLRQEMANSLGGSDDANAKQRVTQQKLHLALLEDRLFRIQNLQELVSYTWFVSICIVHLLLTWIFPRIKYEPPNSVVCQYWYSVMLVSKERLVTMMKATESLIPCNTDVLCATRSVHPVTPHGQMKSSHNSNSRMEMMQQRSAHLSLPVPLIGERAYYAHKAPQIIHMDTMQRLTEAFDTMHQDLSKLSETASTDPHSFYRHLNSMKA